MGDDKSKVFNLGLCKLTLIMSEIEFVLSKPLQYYTYHPIIFLHYLYKNKNIIK